MQKERSRMPGYDEQEVRVFDAIGNVRVEIAAMGGKLDVLALQIGAATGLAQDLDRRVGVLESTLTHARGFGKGVRAGWLAAAALGGGGVASLVGALLRV
jgi:hypothetical protein